MNPELSQKYLEQISEREPVPRGQSRPAPALRENSRRIRENALLKKYDLNHDGVLDGTENEMMLRDPLYQTGAGSPSKRNRPASIREDHQKF